MIQFSSCQKSRRLCHPASGFCNEQSLVSKNRDIVDVTATVVLAIMIIKKRDPKFLSTFWNSFPLPPCNTFGVPCGVFVGNVLLMEPNGFNTDSQFCCRIITLNPTGHLKLQIFCEWCNSWFCANCAINFPLPWQCGLGLWEVCITSLSTRSYTANLIVYLW